MSFLDSALRVLSQLARSPQVRRAAKKVVREGADRCHDTRSRNSGRPSKTDRSPVDASRHALPDREPTRAVDIRYSPSPDGHPDPGEVVWAWIPYEEDPSRGKDRPLLVIAEEEQYAGADAIVIGLMLTSRDRGQGDHVDEHGNRWVDIGSGPWDRNGRPSEVRINRLVQVRSGDVRREGGKLSPEVFTRVAKATRDEYGW